MASIKKEMKKMEVAVMFIWVPVIIMMQLQNYIQT